MKEAEKKIKKSPYMMNRELSWLKFNERVLNEAGNPKVPLAERLTFVSIYQSNLDEFYRVRVGTLMDQMDVSEVVRENKTNMTSEEQVKAIIRATRELEEKKTVIYEQLMGELEPKGIRLINFNKLSAEEGKILEEYFDREIAPYLSANIVSKQQPFPFLKNKDIYAVALLESKGGKTRTAIIPCSNNVFRRLIDIPTRKGTFLLAEELILQFLPKFFKNYSVKEKSLIRVTRNADIDTEMIYDEDLDYRDAMENLIKERKRMNPVRMEFTGTLNKKMMHALCKTIHVEKEHVFRSEVPLDLSFVFAIQSYLKNTNAGDHQSVLNTICGATRERQTEARSIAEEVDAMIVIGDKHSSNTQKLFEICKGACKDTYYIQTLDDLDLNQLGSVETVGITAGASTPNNIIEEVQNNVRIIF